MRERRAVYESRPGYVDEIIVDGTERTRVEVKAVVAEVKKAMGITGTYNQLRRKAEQARKRPRRVGGLTPPSAGSAAYSRSSRRSLRTS